MDLLGEKLSIKQQQTSPGLKKLKTMQSKNNDVLSQEEDTQGESIMRKKLMAIAERKIMERQKK